MVRRRFFGLMAAAPVFILFACSDQPTVDVKEDAVAAKIIQLADPDQGALIFATRSLSDLTASAVTSSPVEFLKYRFP